jgi:hypothetical protein
MPPGPRYPAPSTPPFCGVSTPPFCGLFTAAFLRTFSRFASEARKAGAVLVSSVLRVGPRSKSRPCKASGRLGTQHNLPPIDIKSEAYPIQSSPRACCAVDGNYLKSPHAHRSKKSLLRIRPIFRLPTVHEAQCLHVNGCESWNVNVSFFLLLPSATPCQQRARRASLATGRPSGPQNNPRTVE